MELLTMSQSELRRLEAVHRLIAGSLSQLDVALQLGLSVRQVRRLVRRFDALGAAGLVSAKRGKPSNRRLDPTDVAEALDIVRQRYADFGPTFANEKLREEHGILISDEALRQAMITAGLWKPKHRRMRKAHPPRERRPQFGELIQIDGSPHDWFEGRAPRCNLTVFIDDATSRIVGLSFSPTETTWAYLTLMRAYITKFGRPLAFYSDRHSAFRAPTSTDPQAVTQIGRALFELDIELICATTPQAKGRVERANSTLQRRLTRELRLRKIDSIAEANAFVESYIVKHNERFARAPFCEIDAHRSNDGFNLERLLAVRYERTLSKNCTLQIHRKIWHVGGDDVFPYQRVLVVEQCDARFDIYTGNVRTEVTEIAVQHPQAEVVDSKSLNSRLDRRPSTYIPAPNHPWRTPFRT